MASGTTQIVIKGYDDVMKQLSSMQGKAEKVVSRTIGDFKSRGPSWVSQEVAKEYNIKKKEITETLKSKGSAGTVKVQGTKIDDITLRYEGRLLTPTHFGMKPTTRPGNNKAYSITAQIKKKSGRKTLDGRAFLANSGAEGTKQIPFVRVGDARLPVKSIKTLSVPQMITNDDVSNAIRERINVELGKRLDHNLKQLMKR